MICGNWVSPAGVGGPWNHSDVKAGVPSDPYLMTGFDKKIVTLSHKADQSITIKLQVDIDGAGTWADYKSYHVPSTQTITETLPESFSAYWVRALCNQDANATVMFEYK